MKIIRTLKIDNQPVMLVDIDLTLELSSCGRGFLTVAGQDNFVGKLVTLDIGDSELMRQYFTGYVERSQPSENGYQRLFVRELAAALSRSYPLSLQHPTLAQVCKSITDNIGLPFVIPDKDYKTTPAANFTHAGTGYQLLNNLGVTFGIDDYVWQPLPDGSVFVGSYNDSFWFNKPVTIPPEFTTKHEAGNTISIPVIQSMRPGAIVNNLRIKQVRLSGDNMTLQWVNLNSKGQPAQATPFRRQVEKEFPELAGGQHLPQYARIEAITDTASLGDLCDHFRPRYAADIQLLDASGQADNSIPVYHSVALPSTIGGIEAGLLAYPQPGTIVEVAFNAGMPNQPFIRQILPFAWSLPAVAPGEHIQQQRAEVFQRFNSRGDIERETDMAIIENSQLREISADTEQRNITQRTTTITGSDLTTVGGTAQTHALGAVEIVSAGDIDIAAAGHQRNATNGKLVVAVGDEARLVVGKDLNETIINLRKSVAKQQQFIAEQTWVGSDSVNALTLISQVLDVMQSMASAIASHTHPGDSGGTTGAPNQASSFTGQASQLNSVNQQLKSISM